MRIKRILQGVTLFGIGVLVVCCGRSRGGQSAQGMREYAVSAVEASQIALNRSYPATIRGQQDVEIRPRVNGYITELCVDEGSVVRKGQPLFRIDKVQYEAAVQVAEAAVKVAEATVATSRLTVRNKTELAAQNIISHYDLETAQNELRTREAQLAQAKAQLVSVQKDLIYTTVSSPSAGVVGAIPFRIGSLVGTTTATPLTVVSDISNMYVYFSVNEKELLDLTRQNSSVNKVVHAMPEVELQLADGSLYPIKGKIETMSGVIDRATGTSTLRAKFANPNALLRSGATGNVLLPIVIDQALTIPQKATYEIQNKKYIYRLTDSATVVACEITVLPQSNGQSYIVTSGLNVGDQVVVEGIASLRDGAKIKPISLEESRARVDAAKQQQGAQGAARQQTKETPAKKPAAQK